MRWETCHDARHFPRALALHGCALCAALARAIVLAKAACWIGRAADVVRFAVLGAQEVAAVEGWNGLAFDFEKFGHKKIVG